MYSALYTRYISNRLKPLMRHNTWIPHYRTDQCHLWDSHNSWTPPDYRQIKTTHEIVKPHDLLIIRQTKTTYVMWDLKHACIPHYQTDWCHIWDTRNTWTPYYQTDWCHIYDTRNTWTSHYQTDWCHIYDTCCYLKKKKYFQFR